MSTLTYLKSFFKDKDVASVTPSSAPLIEHVCKSIDFTEDITIVEYGAGTGIFAGYLLEKMSGDSTLVMFETNERFFKKLQDINDPRIDFHHESVEHVDDRLGEELAGNVDYIISGIPFSFLDDFVRKDILQKSEAILKPAGQFLAYQTSGHLKKPLREAFGNVHTKWEWRNVPPMVIYRAVKE